MILERAEHPDWLSNAYLVAEGPGGKGVLVDGNGVIDPLMRRIEQQQIDITHVIATHHHADHIAGLPDLAERFEAPLLAHELTAAELAEGVVTQTIADGDEIRSGGLTLRAIHTPGHAAGHLAVLVDDSDCLTADLIFKGTVGGTRAPGHTTFDDLKTSIMDKVLSLPPETRLHPGHREPTTVADELEHNPFVRIWRGLDPEGDEPCRVWGEEATLVLWAPDYDGTNKAWVRWAAGGDDIVGGSQVERG